MSQNNTDDLYHHGIVGMKWGVRRYQNKDGSLTSAGRKRANKLEQEYSKLTNKKLKSNSEKTSKSKSVSDMSDDELRTKTNRMRLEADYINAYKTMNSLSPKQVSKGKSFINKISKDIIVPVATDVSRQVVKSYVVKFVNEGLNLENDYKVHTNNKKKN